MTEQENKMLLNEMLLNDRIMKIQSIVKNMEKKTFILALVVARIAPFYRL